MKRWIAFILAAVFLVPAAQNSHAIINGQPDGEDHPYVGAVLQFVGGEPVFCSGVAISSTLVLTSGHCVQDESAPIFVNFLSEPSFPDGFPGEFSVGFGYVHPDFCLGCGRGILRFLTHDVAVLELVPGQELDLERYAVLPGEGLVDLLPMHQRLTAVGYGLNQVVPTQIWDVKRYSAKVELIGSNHRVSAEFIRTSANRSKGKGKFCFGDSGGAVLLGDTLIALPSYGPSTVCSSLGYSNRVDLGYFLGFVSEFLPE